MNLFRAAALVVFIIAAVFCFLVPDIELRVDVGLVAVGLACLTVSDWGPTFGGPRG